MKMDVTTLVIIALAVVVFAIPAVLFVNEQFRDDSPRITDYCNANGYWRVDPCIDGSFQAIKDDLSTFTIVKPDGTLLHCPFTFPEYQVGECVDYTTGGMCGYIENICEDSNACVSDMDCSGECVNWSCS